MTNPLPGAESESTVKHHDLSPAPEDLLAFSQDHKNQSHTQTEKRRDR